MPFEAKLWEQIYDFQKLGVYVHVYVRQTKHIKQIMHWTISFFNNLILLLLVKYNTRLFIVMLNECVQ